MQLQLQVVETEVQVRYGKVNVSTHTKWWGRGGDTRISTPGTRAQEPHGIHEYKVPSTGPVPWVSNLHPWYGCKGDVRWTT